MARTVARPRPRPGPGARSDRWYAGLRARLCHASRGRLIRDIAERTGTNPETVRRYLSTGVPSAEFLAAFARAFGVSGDWLLGLQEAERKPSGRSRGLQRDLDRADEALDRARVAIASARSRR